MSSVFFQLLSLFFQNAVDVYVKKEVWSFGCQLDIWEFFPDGKNKGNKRDFRHNTHKGMGRDVLLVCFDG